MSLAACETSTSCALHRKSPSIQRRCPYAEGSTTTRFENSQGPGRRQSLTSQNGNGAATQPSRSLDASAPNSSTATDFGNVAAAVVASDADVSIVIMLMCANFGFLLWPMAVASASALTPLPALPAKGNAPGVAGAQLSLTVLTPETLNRPLRRRKHMWATTSSVMFATFACV